MWGGVRRETVELAAADCVLVLSVAEIRRLEQRGLRNAVWVPPLIDRCETPGNADIGIVGSDSRVNRRGLWWLAGAVRREPIDVRVYGGLGRHACRAGFRDGGAYGDRYDPYRACGIVLMPTAEGLGVQVKGVEALACGRAIVPRLLTSWICGLT